MTVNIGSISNLDNLPDDVLGIIFRQLELDELVGLRCVGKGMNNRVTSLGIPLFLSLHRQPQLTLTPPPDQWAPIDLVERNHYINRSLLKHRFHALQVGPTWPKSVIPTLELTSDNLVVGVGSKVLVHPLEPPPVPQGDSYGSGSRVIHQAVEYDIRTKKDQGGKSDIIGIVPINGSRSEYIIAQFDGTIQRVHLPSSPRHSNGHSCLPQIKARYSFSFNQPKESINTLVGTTDSRQFMTTSVSGLVQVYSTHSPWTDCTSLQLKSPRAWSSLLSNLYDTSLGPMAILGIQGGAELYPLLPTGLAQSPSRKLIGPDEPLLSSPYALTLPDTAQTSHNPNLLLSGWYDSHLRIHDLRHHTRSPVRQFSDQYTWSDGAAYYSACFAGEHHIAGGTSKHGTVSFFDMRNSKLPTSTFQLGVEVGKEERRGWSCFSPNGKGSPVYSLRFDNGKLYGVTERRSFVLSFDRSGEIQNGILSSDLQHLMIMQNNRNRDKGRYAPNGYKARGGKWTWSVRNGGDQDGDVNDVAVGYEHTSKGGVELFDSSVAK
ncbi:hypothetical protein I302_105418 [Kwoniella bestiolae CBS 10118]|uniref:F-box domain-containing protein n=1 Tax=Kwoniella bestiolae CBS 10118 TaxID=1296100 RepID=A0A1B9FT37_9TREE|nr:hypothetical protein I302_08699 [Kwoniella bestiolae CBS 10118]OCF21920.1 hypothetical protein I302_08699 [Kwoniella bestiolae CBS 10118]